MNTQVHTSLLQNIFRILLGVFMVGAAIGHFTFLRTDFQAQVPDWVPVDKDIVVLLSGIPELVLGLMMIFRTKEKVWTGIILAIFYVLVFPGNLSQYINGYSAFGLDTDHKRLVRLFFQPVLIFWALWSTGALNALLKKKYS